MPNGNYFVILMLAQVSHYIDLSMLKYDRYNCFQKQNNFLLNTFSIIILITSDNVYQWEAVSYIKLIGMCSNLLPIVACLGLIEMSGATPAAYLHKQRRRLVYQILSV